MDAIQAQGANLRDLKKKKNAAGRVAKSRRLQPAPLKAHSVSPYPSLSAKPPGYLLSSKYSEDPLSSKSPGHLLSSKSLEPAPPLKTPKMSSKPPGHLLSSKSQQPAAAAPPPLKSPLTSFNPPDTKLMPQQMSWEPDCYQLSLYKHYQAVQYYR